VGARSLPNGSGPSLHVDDATSEFAPACNRGLHKGSISVSALATFRGSPRLGEQLADANRAAADRGEPALADRAAPGPDPTPARSDSNGLRGVPPPRSPAWRPRTRRSAGGATQTSCTSLASKRGRTSSTMAAERSSAPSLSCAPRQRSRGTRESHYLVGRAAGHRQGRRLRRLRRRRWARRPQAHEPHALLRRDQDVLLRATDKLVKSSGVLTLASSRESSSMTLASRLRSE
jgi:hypothetical protein